MHPRGRDSGFVRVERGCMMNDGDREILDHFVRTREKTIELTRNVPEEFLERQPEGEDRAMIHLLGHAGCGERYWMAEVLKAGGPSGPPDAEDSDALVRAMETGRDLLVKFFSAQDGEAMARLFTRKINGHTDSWTGRNRLLYLISHEVHHRGKIVLALRQWGFEDIPFLPF